MEYVLKIWAMVEWTDGEMGSLMLVSKAVFHIQIRDRMKHSYLEIPFSGHASYHMITELELA